MTKKEKYNAITTAYEIKKVDDPRGEISILKDNADEEIKNILLDIQKNLEVSFELSYSILHDASSCLSNIELDKLEATDWTRRK